MEQDKRFQMRTDAQFLAYLDLVRTSLEFGNCSRPAAIRILVEQKVKQMQEEALKFKPRRARRNK